MKKSLEAGSLLEKSLIGLGFILVAIGIVIILASIIYAVLRGSSTGQVQAGGIIFIGPIPIIWGSSKEISKVLLIIASIISTILIAVYIYSLLKPQV